MRLAAGRAKIAGLVLPEQAAAVRGRVALIDCRDLPPARNGQGGLRQDLRTAERRDPVVIMIDHADELVDADDRAALASLVEETGGSASRALLMAARDRALIDDVIRRPYRHLTLGPVPDLADSHHEVST
jgi:RND superfamily putative drug exporter